MRVVASVRYRRNPRACASRICVTGLMHHSRSRVRFDGKSCVVLNVRVSEWGILQLAPRLKRLKFNVCCIVSKRQLERNRESSSKTRTSD